MAKVYYYFLGFEIESKIPQNFKFLKPLILFTNFNNLVQIKVKKYLMRSFVKLLLCSSIAFVKAAEPNPPHWDTHHVKIIDPNDHGAQKTVDDIFHEVGGNGNHGEFSDSRYAILFKPGYHHVNVRVGFYTQVMGLGDSPKDVTLSNLHSPDGSTDPHHGALCNFWRSAENVQMNGRTIWSVS